ncbi:hypothetical protein VaNZ11_006001 [Volvox africanus]|uniref:Guanylate cyclase domain-containing protein n=1 Tax=Volvox africanus TaxID=51714 RepID=A0ABQ5S192_9CHLO|nr:hypothetical protein VaNZ11_006001 [Volvox africanus]
MLEARCQQQPAGRGQLHAYGVSGDESPLCKDDLRSYVDGTGKVLAVAVLEVRSSTVRSSGCITWLTACLRPSTNEDVTCNEGEQLSFATLFAYGGYDACRDVDVILRAWLQGPAGAALRAAARCAVSRTPCSLEVKLPGALYSVNDGGARVEGEQQYQIKSCLYDDGVSPPVPALAVMQLGAPERVAMASQPMSGGFRVHTDTGLWANSSVAQSTPLFDACMAAPLLAVAANLAVEGAACCVTLLQYPSGLILFQNPRSKAFAGDLVGKHLGAIFLRQLLSELNCPDALGDPLEVVLQALEAGREFEAVVQVPATLGDLERVAEHCGYKDSDLFGTLKHLHLQHCTSALTDLLGTDEDEGGQEILDTEDRFLLQALLQCGLARGRGGFGGTAAGDGSPSILGAPPGRRRIRRSISLHDLRHVPLRSPTNALLEALQRPVQSISRARRPCSQRALLTPPSRATSFSMAAISNFRSSGLRTTMLLNNLSSQQHVDVAYGAGSGSMSGRSRLRMANSSSLYHSGDLVIGPRCRPETGSALMATSSAVSAAVDFLGLPRRSAFGDHRTVPPIGAVRDTRMAYPLSQQRQYQHRQSHQSQQSQPQQRAGCGGSNAGGATISPPLARETVSTSAGSPANRPAPDHVTAGSTGYGGTATATASSAAMTTVGANAVSQGSTNLGNFLIDAMPGSTTYTPGYSIQMPTAEHALTVAGSNVGSSSYGGSRISGGDPWAFMREREFGPSSWGPANSGDVSNPASTPGMLAAAMSSHPLQIPLCSARTAPTPWEGHSAHRHGVTLSRMRAITVQPRPSAGQLIVKGPGANLMTARYSSPPAVRGPARRGGSVLSRAAATYSNMAVAAPNAATLELSSLEAGVQSRGSASAIVGTRSGRAVQALNQAGGVKSQSSTTTRAMGLDSLTLATLSVIRQTNMSVVGREDSADQQFSQNFHLQILAPQQQLKHNQEAVYSAGSSRLGRDAVRSIDFMPNMVEPMNSYHRTYSTPTAFESQRVESDAFPRDCVAERVGAKASSAAVVSVARPASPQALLSVGFESKRSNNGAFAITTGSVGADSVDPGSVSRAALTTAAQLAGTSTRPADSRFQPGEEAGTQSSPPPRPEPILPLPPRPAFPSGGGAVSPNGETLAATQSMEVATSDHESHLLLLGAIHDEAPVGVTSTAGMQGLSMSVSMHTGDCTGLQSAVTTATGHASTSTLIIQPPWPDASSLGCSPYRSSVVRQAVLVQGATRQAPLLREAAALGIGHPRHLRPPLNVTREAETSGGVTTTAESESCLPALGSLPTSPFASHPSLVQTTIMHLDEARLSGQCGGGAVCGVDGAVGFRSFRPMVADASHNSPGPVRGSKMISSAFTAALPPAQIAPPEILSAGTTAAPIATAGARPQASTETSVLADTCVAKPMQQAQQPAATAVLPGGGRCYGIVGNTAAVAATATAITALLARTMVADVTDAAGAAPTSPHDTHTLGDTPFAGLSSAPLNLFHLIDSRRRATVDGLQGEPNTGAFPTSHDSTVQQVPSLGGPSSNIMRGGMRQRSRRSVPLRSQSTARRLTQLLNSFSTQTPYSCGGGLSGCAAVAAGSALCELPVSGRQQHNLTPEMSATADGTGIGSVATGACTMAAALAAGMTRGSTALSRISSAVISPATAHPLNATAAAGGTAMPRRVWQKIVIHCAPPQATPTAAATTAAATQSIIHPSPLGRDAGSGPSGPACAVLSGVMGSRTGGGGGQSSRLAAAAGGHLANRTFMLTVTQIDVTEQVEAQAGLAKLLEQEHKVLEGIFPRHVIEYMTLQEGAKPTPMASPKGAGGSSFLSLVPGSVERMASLATWHPGVTILFADCVGFTSMCHAATPLTVMGFLNQLYSRFDDMIDIYKVYKVETIGDCYMVAGGLVAYDDDGYKSVISGTEDPLHAVRVMEFAKAMLRASQEVRMPHTGEPVQMRIGLHSGPVTSGVVGDRMPRFCVFGDTVNVASRMESTCRPGCIHVSAATHARLPKEAWRDLGMTVVKGKGEMRTFEWAGDVDAPVDGNQLQRVIGLYL